MKRFSEDNFLNSVPMNIYKKQNSNNISNFDLIKKR